jgi:IS605 OrfB family transposase
MPVLRSILDISLAETQAENMRLVVNLKLKPTREQHTALKRTLEQANAVCNEISAAAWDQHVFGQYALHKLVYHAVRASSGLTAQVVVRCIAKVADAYKLDREARRSFRPLGALAYDDRILRFKAEDHVSIWTVDGRQVVPFVCGDRQRELLAHRKGETDLLFVRGIFYLSAVCEVDEPELIKTTDVLGVDLGIVNIATDSDGTVYSGAAVEENRRKATHRRRNLQRKGTRSAARKLLKVKGKQARYQKDVNHRISKALVSNAQRTGRGLALEDLKGIRERVTARKRQRARLSNWSFFQLRAFVSYKARLSGVPVVFVDPRNTSRECPSCGHTEKANRKSQAEFLCRSCGRAGLADHIAALNICSRVRADVNQPMVANGHASRSPSATSRRL